MAQPRSKTRTQSKKSKSKSNSKSRSKPKTSREKVAAYRAKMRAKGMRLVQMWVPDTRTPEFAAEARRQSRLLARDPRDKADQDFVESLIDWDDM